MDALHYYQVKLTGEMCIARIVSASLFCLNYFTMLHFLANVI